MPADDNAFSQKGYEPLAARMRPASLEEYVGQEEILGKGKLLRRSIEADQLSSIILWGPPGSGKTTLAHVIAQRTESRFLTLNAVLSGVKDIRASIASAKEFRSENSRRSILFVDEVHRFNKAQQDALLPHVENGTIILIGATTENPYFEVNKPLVSRSRIFELKTLSQEEIRKILLQALANTERGYGNRSIDLATDALAHISNMAQGDARSALNALELAVETTGPDAKGVIHITREVAEESIQRRALLYDKDGDVHYDTISAFIKSLRGSDPDAALYWMARMLYSGEDPRFIARRMVIFASEDIGMADPLALQVATAAANAVEYVGMPECQFNLSQACIHLASAEKSNSTMAYFDALKCVEKEGFTDVPPHLKDPSRDKKGLGHGKGYKYPHAHREHWVPQQYLPDKLEGNYFYHPTGQGYEEEVRKRLASLREGKKTAGERGIQERHGRDTAPWERWQRSVQGKRRVKQRDLLLRQVSLEKNESVLDLGSEGLFAWGVLRDIPLGSALCVFSRDAALREFREKRKQFRVDRIIDGALGPAFPPHIADRRFSAVFAFHPFSKSDDFEGFVKQIRDVLTETGRFCFIEALPARRKRLWQEVDFTELPDPMVDRIIEAEESLYAQAGGIFAMNENTLNPLLRDNGFEVLTLDLRDEEKVLNITASFIDKLFAPAADEWVRSYGDRLREVLSSDEVEQVRDIITRQLQNKTLQRSEVTAYVTAGGVPENNK